MGLPSIFARAPGRHSRVGLGRQAVTDSDEAFYAEAAREMFDGGDWLTPHFNYQERWEKPVLYYWLTAATYLPAGPSAWAARWWSAMSGLGLVLLTWGMARRMMARRDAAWLAAGVVATCFGYFAMARLALPDLPLTFFVTLAIWSMLEGWWIVAGAAAGLGFLMKGPVALVVPIIVLIPIWWRERRSLSIRSRDVVAAALVFAAVGLPWYGAMTARHGVEYLQSFFVGDNLQRFATDRFNDPRPFWFYLPILLGGMLPWTAYLVLVPWRSATAVIRRRRHLLAGEWRLLIWVVAPLLFFTISVGKQPRYILPVLPPLAILLAGSITRRLLEPAGTSRTSLTISTWITAAMYAALGVLLLRAQPLFLSVHPTMTYAAAVVLLASSLALVWLAISRRWRMFSAVTAACATLMLLSVQFGALAGLQPEPVEVMAASVRSHRTANEPVGAYQVMVRNLIFYTRIEQVELFDEGRALDFLKSPERVLLVVRELDLPRLEEISGVQTKRLADVKYLDTANVRLRTLIAPMPAQDLETVLLVSNK